MSNYDNLIYEVSVYHAEEVIIEDEPNPKFTGLYNQYGEKLYQKLPDKIKIGFHVK